MNYLLDTNVISELVAAEPNSNVTAWIDSIKSENVYLSVITIGELQHGIEKLQPSKRRKVLNDWLYNDLRVRFKDRIIPIDVPIILTWGTLIAHLEARGKPIPAIDSLMAATALEMGLVLATRNVRDFANTGIPLVNPWES